MTLLAAISLASAASRAPVWSKAGMAATPHTRATDAAVTILASGGNAIDAAVAAAFVLGVVEPYHSGLGGGEFALVRMAKEGVVHALDARESAPAASTRGMYLNPTTGEPDGNKSWRGGLAVGVPGSVAGRVELTRKFGSITLAQIVDPARKLAAEGFLIDRILADRIGRYADVLAEDRAAGEVFLDGIKPKARGEKMFNLRQAETLRQIGRDGGRSFYRGEHAGYIAAACAGAGGILTARDLADYKIIWREPVHFTYRGCDNYSMSPPSSGGVCLAEIFNLLEGFPLNYLDLGSAETYHLIASASEIAFADRARWLGDPDFTPQPVSGLTSKGYADSRRKDINRYNRIPIAAAGDAWQFEGNGNTSHISVIDREGNMCAITTSVNSAFGSMVFVPELGIFLNSTMDDFATLPDSPNKFELVGGDVNAIEPGKRPLSSMSPTLVVKDGHPYLSLGSVGGPRIITSVAQMLINVIDFAMNIQAAMDVPRIHMQWKPDKLFVEDDIPPEVISELRRRGWTVQRDGRWSISQGVMFDFQTGAFFGAADARGVGSAGPIGDR